MIRTVPETGSTNADLLARLRSGEHLVEGEWLVADRQTRGRGRQGREWFDDSGNFMGSTVARLLPGDPAPSTLTFVASLALHETLRRFLPGTTSLKLKWPNDLLLENAKVSGILLEWEGQTVVVGVGVNLRSAPDVGERRVTAVSDHAPAPDRDRFAGEFAAQFATELDRWRSYGFEPIRSRWLAAAHPVGTALAVHDADGHKVTGSFAGLSQDGSLLLRTADGATQTVHAGDLELA
ncbi:biotin--[acetyl-CoA-carboxylase] ligase [Qipengyuania sp. JC766]|uniref:biotin--[acetyl-CoA-carboxylase] ligase n=1 Tax=Qipengyuania sp. JC766 TaxID=3232139 RepID=UPI0034577A8D